MKRIAIVVGIAWAGLRRDRAALALTFALPLVFFTVFASVFGNLDEPGGQTLQIGLQRASSGPFSTTLVDRLASAQELEIVADDFDADRVRQALATGRVDAVVVIPADFDANIDDGAGIALQVLTDASNPLVAPAVTAHLNAAVIATATELGDGGASDEPALKIDVVDALGGERKRASTAFFAAGLGVLFLMLSLANRAAVLHDERDDGTLERTLASQLALDELLLGRGLFYTLLGVAQITAMFAWAWLVFGLDLPGHLGGFALMAVFSATAAASFALLLTMACRSREQQNAAATIVVLLLAAVGGNLFPRFLMPEWLQTLGTYTFNGWALEGFQQVFWYEAPIPAVLPHLLVLALTTAGLYGIARVLATHWVHG